MIAVVSYHISPTESYKESMTRAVVRSLKAKYVKLKGHYIFN